MASPTLLSFLLLLLLSPSLSSAIQNSTLIFREYIGSTSTGIKFSDVPINDHLNFHFILSFANDYTTTTPHTHTNGHFNVFWDKQHLNSSEVTSIKQLHPNVRVALSLGGNYFKPYHASINSWVNNAASSLTSIVRDYDLDGIDIDYQQFKTNPRVFAECIGRLLERLKREGVVSFASIAPSDDRGMQKHYLALWRRYGYLIDYVNFQFYKYAPDTTVAEFLRYFDAQSSNYRGGKVLVSFRSSGGGGLSPENGFFRACRRLRREGKLYGIVAWSADASVKDGFVREKEAQLLLAAGPGHLN